MSKPSKVLIIGSGPIVIGQAAEFDYERKPR
jgi:carbamoyl-phosphate synthase large subunit